MSDGLQPPLKQEFGPELQKTRSAWVQDSEAEGRALGGGGFDSTSTLGDSTRTLGDNT